MSNSVQPHWWQPSPLGSPIPGILQARTLSELLFLSSMHESESEVAQSCPTLSDPVDRSLPGSSVHGLFQARVLQWGAIAFSAHWDWKIYIINECLNVIEKYWFLTLKYGVDLVLLKNYHSKTHFYHLYTNLTCEMFWNKLTSALKWLLWKIMYWNNNRIFQS